ncbi:srg family chemoreceptor domain-containing protein [Ditylenchus destructor]|nr:srg family chemoreceptor domain-containing protein [Ditylenchus destructor]
MVKYRAATAPLFFPLFDHLPFEGWGLTVLFFFNYALLITSRSANFLLTLNRFTVIQFSTHVYNKIWRYLLPLSVILMCAIAGLLNISILLTGCYVKRPNETQYLFYFEPYDPGVEYRQSLYSIAVIIAFAPAMILSNMSIAYSLWRRRKQRLTQTSNQDTQKGSDAEAKLCVLTFTMLVTNLVGLVCQMFFFVAGGGPNMDPGLVQTLSTIQGFAEDVHILSEPWMLVFMSKGVRASLLQVLCLGKLGSNLVSTATNKNSKVLIRSMRQSININNRSTNVLQTV